MDPNERGDGTGMMCARLMEMRNTQRDVMDMKRKREGEIERERERDKEKEGQEKEGEDEEEEEGEDGVMSLQQLPNLYAGNLKVILGGGQRERYR